MSTVRTVTNDVMGRLIIVMVNQLRYFDPLVNVLISVFDLPDITNRFLT